MGSWTSTELKEKIEAGEKNLVLISREMESSVKRDWIRPVSTTVQMVGTRT